MNQRQKQTLMAGIIALLAIVLIAIVAWVVTGEYRFKTFRSERYSYSVGYPAKWELVEDAGDGAVAFVSPMQNDLDIFRENINIVVRDLSSYPMDLYTYSEKAIEEMKGVFQDHFVLLESKSAKLSGEPGHKIVFIGKGPEAELKFMCVWTIKDLKAYQIMYTAVSSQYDGILLNMKRVLGSFRIE